MTKKPTLKDFDLPVVHLPEGGHYKPPKARDEQEVLRRRRLPRGSLLVEKQEQGLMVASRILTYLTEEEELEYATQTLGATGLNTAWYAHARGAHVMRRRLKLPKLEDYETPPDRQQLVEAAACKIADSLPIAGMLTYSVKHQHCTIGRFNKQLGVALGNASTALASVNRADEIVRAQDPERLQIIAREGALATLGIARNMAHTIGTHPSMAQLADPDSDLSVYWRRDSPNIARDAYEFAVAA